MKQTAVEWLVEQLPERMKNYMNDSIAIAKEMEKEQIVDAANNFISERELDDGEIYYNKIFKSE